MQRADKNIEELLRELTGTFHRLRQDGIDDELFEVISGFDEAVQGMEVGESVQVRLAPEEAYGERNPDLVLAVPADNAPDGLTEGDRVQIRDGGVATVVEVTDDFVTIDAKHPLAGQALTFAIELVAVS